MPYAQSHYPFENQELFKQSFPADFIAEGIDQVHTNHHWTYLPHIYIHFPFNKDTHVVEYMWIDISLILNCITNKTRGWFYTLLVLSTALFDEPAWKNLIVNGLVLAA